MAATTAAVLFLATTACSVLPNAPLTSDPPTIPPASTPVETGIGAIYAAIAAVVLLAGFVTFIFRKNGRTPAPPTGS